jgi:predicted adenylyl cyclase CyaB
MERGRLARSSDELRMRTGTTETEIKLPISDPEIAVRSVEKLNAHILMERHLEDNYIFDHEDGLLSKERKLLRVRIIAGADFPHRETRAVLTYKGAPDIADGVKQREEIECEIKGGQNMMEILTRLAYKITFRYQKYRTIYTLPNVELDICIDETPIGNFFELEGEILRIHEFATKLGYNRDDYISQSYSSLYFRWCQKTGSQEPFMLFPSQS